MECKDLNGIIPGSLLFVNQGDKVIPLKDERSNDP
jgi:hypothetical protein